MIKDFHVKLLSASFKIFYAGRDAEQNQFPTMNPPFDAIQGIRHVPSTNLETRTALSGAMCDVLLSAPICASVSVDKKYSTYRC